MQHPDPIGSGLATGAIVEAAGPDCIIPGQIPPVKLLGVKVPAASLSCIYTAVRSCCVDDVPATPVE